MTSGSVLATASSTAWPAKSGEERSLSQLITGQLYASASRATKSSALILCVARHERGTTSS